MMRYGAHQFFALTFFWAFFLAFAEDNLLVLHSVSFWGLALGEGAEAL